jgi:hypothetical protein
VPEPARPAPFPGNAPLPKKGVYLTGLTGTPLDKLCFVTVHMPSNIYDANSTALDWYVGAVPDLADPDEKKRKWSRVDRAWIDKNKAKLQHNLVWEVAPGGPIHMSYLQVFADRATSAMIGFTHEKRLDYCVGGTSVCSGHAIVIRALTKAFESIGLKIDKPGALQKLLGSDASLGDVGAIFEQVKKQASKLDGNVYEGFEAVNVAESKAPWGAAVKDTAFKWPPIEGVGRIGYRYPWEEFWATRRLPVDGVDPKQNPYMAAIKEIHSQHKSAFKEPSKGMLFVAEYCFRGDTRLPIQIQVAGGMFANAIRDDKAAVVDARNDEKDGLTRTLDNQKHQHDGIWATDSSAYVSCARSRFASEEFMNRAPRNGNGYIYLVRVESGVDVNGTWAEPRVPMECEISVPGGVGWESVVGWRKMVNTKFSGPLFLTKDSKRLPDVKRKALKEAMSFPPR